MKPYFEDSHCTIYHGDCREVLPRVGPFDTCITDPPYGLGFMGKDWDHGVPGQVFWGLVSHALLPGAMCLAFGGTRTHHRLICAIEDAGFEIRDCLMWLYGTGFPKSLNISKALDKAAGAEREVVGPRPNVHGRGEHRLHEAWRRPWMDDPDAVVRSVALTAPATEAAKLWDGWGTALKPAWEPIVLAMKPRDGTFAQNAVEHGVAGLNIDAARIATHDGYTENSVTQGVSTARTSYDPRKERRVFVPAVGRWPANVVLDEEAAAMLDEQSGESTSRQATTSAGFRDSARVYGGGHPVARLTGANDSGGASRFFYTAKASRADRGEGNAHPTVKPTDLMEWLCKLTATPTGGTVLDPFMGSGSTLLAALKVGRKSVGIETEEKYCEIAANRLGQGVLDLEGTS